MRRRSSCLMSTTSLPHTVASGLRFDLEFTPASFAADEDEAREGEGFRLAEPAPLAVFRRKSSELDEPGSSPG